MKTLLKTTSILLALMFLLQSCAVTRIVQEYDCNTFENNPAYQKTTYSYFWGLRQMKDIDPKCCEGCGINQVEIINQFDHTLISFFTLGIVMPQKVRWCCQPEDIDIGDL